MTNKDKYSLQDLIDLAFRADLRFAELGTFGCDDANPKPYMYDLFTKEVTDSIVQEMAVDTMSMLGYRLQNIRHEIMSNSLL